jgi:hypothetical protein
MYLENPHYVTNTELSFLQEIQNPEARFIGQSIKHYLGIFEFHKYTISAYADIVKVKKLRQKTGKSMESIDVSEGAPQGGGRINV